MVQVTLPAPNPVTLTFADPGAGVLAQQIAAALTNALNGSTLRTTTVTASSVIPSPPTVSGEVQELVFVGAGGGVSSVPAGYDYIVANLTSAETIIGAPGAELIGNGGATVGATVGMTYLGTGAATVDLAGGNNVVSIVGAGSDLIYTGAGSDSVYADGSGASTISAGAGTNFIQAAVNAGSSAYITSSGSDVISLGGGAATVAATTGSSASVIGGAGNLYFSQQANSISSAIDGGSGSVTAYGSDGSTLIYSSTLGSATLVAGSGSETIVGTAQALRINGGSGSDALYVGAGSTATIYGGGGSITVGGAAGSVIDYVASAGSATLVAGSGNETLNGAGASSGVFLVGGAGSDVMIGGSGADTMSAGAGADTMTGGAGSNVFAFFAGTTSGKADVITDWNATDAVYFIGYDSKGSASSLQAAATGPGVSGTGTGVTLTLSDGTAITFSSLTGTSALNGRILYAGAACYVAGTLIATADGEKAVEGLAIGELVRSAFGGLVPVKWLGYRRVDCTRHPKPSDVWPVRVAAGAFGDDLPMRDLFLSPDHAVYANGGLTPIRYLINGATISQIPVDFVAYWHVELPAHDVILAEGLPAESYLDTGNRGAFANALGAVMLTPDFALRVWEAESCAPLVHDGEELTALRDVLMRQAAARGHRIANDPEVHLFVDGLPVVPRIWGRWLVFALPGAGRTVRLVSRAAPPAWTDPASADHRTLGVAVGRLMLNGAAIALDGPGLGAGWHAHEADGDGNEWRWTDGDAELLLPEGGLLAVEVALSARRWVSVDANATLCLPCME